MENNGNKPGEKTKWWWQTDAQVRSKCTRGALGNVRCNLYSHTDVHILQYYIVSFPSVFASFRLFIPFVCLFVYLISVTHALRTSQTHFQIKSKQCSQMLTHSFCSGDGNFFVFFSNSAMRIFFSFFFNHIFLIFHLFQRNTITKLLRKAKTTNRKTARESIESFYFPSASL